MDLQRFDNGQKAALTYQLILGCVVGFFSSIFMASIATVLLVSQDTPWWMAVLGWGAFFCCSLVVVGVIIFVAMVNLVSYTTLFGGSRHDRDRSSWG